jgi:hypothetical protein
MAYYIAHAYMQRVERIAQGYARTAGERYKKYYRMAFLNEAAKKYIRLSDELDRLEKEFVKKGV